MKLKDLQPKQLEEAAEMLKAMAHPMRMSILVILEGNDKLSVSEIQKQINIKQSTVSHHLRILKDKGVLESERNGRKVRYSLKHAKLANVLNCVGSCVIKN